jgi:hypothetical protein
MRDFENDGTIDPSGEGDQDGLHIRDHPAERIEFNLEGLGQHE